MLKTELQSLIRSAGTTAHHKLSKNELIKRAQNLGILPLDYVRQKDTRTNPRVITVTNVDTGNIEEFPSLYRAAKYLDVTAMALYERNGKILKKTYKIEF